MSVRYVFPFWSVGLNRCDACKHIVPERGLDGDLQTEVGDPAVLRVPVAVLAGATQERVEGVDRGLPQQGTAFEVVRHRGRTSGTARDRESLRARGGRFDDPAQVETDDQPVPAHVGMPDDSSSGQRR